MEELHAEGLANPRRPRVIAAATRALGGRLPFSIREAFPMLTPLRAANSRSDQPRACRSLRISVQSAPASGDPDLIQRLVSNLIDNALDYNHPGGNIQVLADAQARQARLTVTNTGPHVPPDQVGRLLQPFQRMTTDRTGHHDGLGLGLSIVVAIAGSHHATLHARSGTNGGLDIQVTFPAVTHEPEHRGST